MSKKAPDRVKATMMLPADLWRRVRAAAILREEDAQDLVARVLDEHIETWPTLGDRIERLQRSL